MKKHIFLTGDKQVGKSTIIRKFLQQSGMSADGFMTYWEAESSENRSLYLSAYGADLKPAERYLVTKSTGKGFNINDDMINVFNTYGSQILKDSGKCDLLIMDELGFMESKAFDFQQNVMRFISGDAPVFGVIKPVQTEFLNSIRLNPNVEVKDVTPENRDAVLKWLLERKWI